MTGPSLSLNNTNVARSTGEVILPSDAFGGGEILSAEATGSEYRRFIFQASQSYWSPTDVVNNDIQNINDFNSDSNEIEVFSGSTNFGLTPIKDTSGKYPITVVSQSAGVPFKGSCMPSGELFKIFFNGDLGGITSSFVTDVRVTLTNPSNVLSWGKEPFSSCKASF